MYLAKGNLEMQGYAISASVIRLRYLATVHDILECMVVQLGFRCLVRHLATVNEILDCRIIQSGLRYSGLATQRSTAEQGSNILQKC